jgi:hypothetical protein
MKLSGADMTAKQHNFDSSGHEDAPDAKHTGLREIWENHARKYTVRGIAGVVFVTIGLEVLHSFHLLESIPFLKNVPSGEILSVAVFLLMILLIEQLFANDKQLDEFAQSSALNQNTANQNLKRLSEQVESTTGISQYWDKKTFLALWERLRDDFDSIILIGEVPINFRAEFKAICDAPDKMRDKRFEIYRSLSIRTQGEVSEILDYISDDNKNLVSLYHMYGFEWGSWVMARKDLENETQVLLNYANADGDSLPGLHLTGSAAKAFEKATGRDLLSGASYRPIKLFSPEQVRFIVEEKVAYQKKITEMADQGVPLVGADAICKEMIRLVSATKEKLNVTHLCIDEESIEQLTDQVFVDWIQANYDAIENSGIKIRRIFLVWKKDFDNTILQTVMKKMNDKGIKVSLCALDDLRDDFKEDFSIYDGKHLVHMATARSYWSKNDQVSARRTENTVEIERYDYIFNALEHRS